MMTGARADGREGFKVEGMFLVFQTPGRYAEFRKTVERKRTLRARRYLC